MTLLDSSQPAPDQSFDRGSGAPAALPDAHALFPDIEEHHNAAAGAGAHLPDANDLFPDMPEPAPRRPITGAVAPGPVGDWIFGNTQHSSLARIMDAFGATVDQDIGHYGEKLGLSEETSKALRDKGIFNDYAQGQHNIGKALNETLLRSGAVLVNGAIYGMPAVWHGLQEAVMEAGTQAEESGIPEFRGMKGVARSIAAVPEAFPDFNFRMGMPHAPVPEPLAAARDLNVIGPGGEAAWKGVGPEVSHETGGPTVPVEAAAAEALPSTPAAAPEPVAPGFVRFFHGGPPEGGQLPHTGGGRWTTTDYRYARDYRRTDESPGQVWYVDIPKGDPTEVAARAWDEQLDAGTNAVGTYRHIEVPEEWAKQMRPYSPAEAPAQAAAPDVHAIARSIAPETFTEFDALEKRRDLFRKWIDEGGAQVPPNVAQNLKETEARLRELEPAVTAAYTKAKEGLPAITEAENAGGTEAANPSAGGSPEAQAAAAPASTPEEGAVPPEGAPSPRVAGEAGAEAAPRPIDASTPSTSAQDAQHQRDHIVSEVRQSLIDAGRPSEEAQAAAQLVAARYEARAARFNGALGTPQELFDRESADIRKMERVAKSTKRLVNPNSARALDDFQERMAQAKELRRKAMEAGGGAVRVMSAEERFAGVTEGEWKAQLEDSIEALEPEERQSVREDLSHLPAEDLAYLAERAEAGLPLFQIEANKVSFADRLPEGAEVERDHEHHSEHQNHEAFVYDVAYTDDGHAVVSNIRGGEEEHLQPASQLLNAMQYRRLQKEIADSVQGHLEDRAEEATATKQWEALTPQQQAAELAEQERAQAERSDAITVRINAAVDAALARGWRPEVNQYGGWKRPPELEEFASPTSAAKIRARLAEKLPATEARELNQKALGSFQVIEGERPILKLAKSANASTFIHESGHEWLEQLMRDDAHPLAPADLKADAKTVRDWLGIENHQDLNTGWPGERGQKARAAHEKFARGFEQYLRLGVAPSPQLAAVFAKFKAWLTRIYQTLKGLGEPISEDIRGVFDRMLASEPQRVVAGAEREESPGFHNLAASLAESTEPAKAADVADKIQSERDFHATQDMINSYDERLANVEPGTGGRAAGTPQSPSHGNEAGPEVRSAGDDTQAGSLGAGGGEVATASPGAPPQAGGGQGVKSEIPSGPNAKFATPPSDFIDKAGNIRLDKLATPDDVTSVIRMAARDNNDFLQERRGVLSDGATLELADALGMDPAWLDRKKIGEAFNVEEIRAARRLLVQSATDVRDAMIAAKPEDEASMRNLAEIMARHEMIQGKVSGATAEAGRALAAFREVIAGGEEALDFNSWLKQNTGRTLFQLQQMAKFGKDLTSASQVSKFVHDTANGRVKQAIIYYYVNALISGPVTHARYFAGNALTALWAPLVKTPIAAAVSGTRAILGYEDAQRVYLGEAGAELYALGKGSREGWKAAREGWETGNTPNLPGEGAPELFGTQPMIPPIPGKIGYAIGLPGKAVGAIHGFSSAVRYEQEIAKLAYRQAMQEGLSGDAFTNRVADLGNRPTAEMTEAASKVARSDLYMAPTEYDSLAGKLTRAANHNVLTKIIVPFMKIGTQITRNALIEQSPLGVFDKKVRANLSGANGDAARATQAASIIGGTALMGTMAMMTAEGVATGDGPSDPGKRAVWLLSHHPNSIQIGSVTIPYKGLGSLGMLMSLAANAYETHQGWGDEEGHSVALDYLHGFEKAVLDESFMRGVKDMIDAVYHFEEYGDRYIANMVTNWIPFSVGLGQIARTSHFLGIPNPAGDEFQRETRGNSLGEMILKEAEAKVPWLSQNLMPRRDMFGEPIPSSGPVQNYANDRTAKVMDDLHMKVGRLPHKIRGVQLSDQQFDDFSRIAGKTAKMRLDSMMKTTGQHLLQTGQTEDRVKLAELMHKIITQSREEASKTVMMHAYGSDNDIQAKATEAKKVKKGIIPALTVH